jgi:hypothetical protein
MIDVYIFARLNYLVIEIDTIVHLELLGSLGLNLGGVAAEDEGTVCD